MKEKLLKEFAELFGDGGEILCYFSPGRVRSLSEVIRITTEAMFFPAL